MAADFAPIALQLGEGDPQTFTARCFENPCNGKPVAVSFDAATAKALAVWHVYEDHHDVWLRVFGDRPPLDPDPRTLKGA